MITEIFFDFDGVLAESVQVKSDAFFKLYLPYGEEVAQKALNHHINNGGMSRFEKFKFYHETFLNIKVDEALIEKLAADFSTLVIEGVINSPEVIGANEFLKENFKNFKYFIITGTPIDEINYILQKRNMDHYFTGVFGSPVKKNIWTEHVIKKYELNRDKIVFVGDALADYEAAKSSNIHFILRETSENIPLFNFFTGQRIADIRSLSESIAKLF